MKPDKVILIFRNSVLMFLMLFLTCTLHGQIVHTELPEFTSIFEDETYEIDFNGDGIVELHIGQEKGGSSGNITNRLFVQMVTSGQTLSVSNAIVQAVNLNSGHIINNSYTYHEGPFLGMVTNGIPISGYQDEWYTNRVGYIGVKFEKDGNTYFGWIHVEVWSNMQACDIFSYAYESRPGVAIKAGAKDNTDAASAVTASDIANNNNASDMEVSFTKASSESGIEYYRIFVVPATATFGLAQAQMITEANRYHQISPNGNNRTITLPASLKDAEGNTIQNGTAYKVYVMSVGNNTHSDNLSGASGELTMMSPTHAAVDVEAEEVDGRVSVSFDKASVETGISAYRVFVVPAEEADEFDLETAASLAATSYQNVTPNGNNQTVLLRTSIRDTEGNELETEKEYVVFVMSAGATGYYNALSESSDVFEMEEVLLSNNGLLAEGDFYYSENKLFIRNLALEGAVQVVNSSGRRVLSTKVSRGDSHVDLSTLHEGMYVVVLSGEGRVQTLKVVK